MIFTFSGGQTIFYTSFLIAIFFAGIISIVSFKLKMLSKSGAAAAFILGSVIFTFGELKWSIPLISFFLFSSLISKAGKKYKENFKTVFEKTSRRNYGQVLANGITGGFLVILNLFYPSEILYLMFVGSMSAVCADTWATEIGTMKETPTYNIKTFNRIEQGLSGGVSLSGTFGALAGTLIIAFSAIYWIHLNIIYYFCLIIFSGLVGSFIDSILGATIQNQNKCFVCGKITEKNFHCSRESNHFRGVKFLTNDLVNFIAAFSGSATVYFINLISN